LPVLLRHVVLKEKRVFDRISVLLTLLVRCLKEKKSFWQEFSSVASLITTCCFKGEKSFRLDFSAVDSLGTLF
jgi:hypothetical protein